MQGTYSVYCHTNKSNGKRYVGITKGSVTRRWQNGHGYRNNSYFTAAIEKYGWDGFTHEVLYRDLTEEEAQAMEIKLIAEWNLQDRRFGYNQTAGGGGAFNPTEEVRQKMSEAGKTEGRRAQLAKMLEKSNEAWRGQKHSPETIRKMSEKKIGHTVSEEARRKMSEAKKGKPSWNAGRSWSEETRAKMSYAAKHRKSSRVAQQDQCQNGAEC